MYPLIAWKWIGIGLTFVTLLAVYADNVQHLTGLPISESAIVRYLPLTILLILGGFFGPTNYWAPWRILWRIVPKLNDWFPDLNGVWVGSTSSNWPTIKKLFEVAQSDARTTENELHELPNQRDAMAVKLTSSLFKLKICAALSSTNGTSYSITAKPWRHQHTDCIHLSYVYRQNTPNHEITDEEAHLGAADLEMVSADYSKVEGTYWTRRAWQTGRNTAGILELSRLTARNETRKSLQQYAIEHKKTLDTELTH